MLEPWVTTISSAARPNAMEMMPAQSVLPGRPASGADSGICRISAIEATDTSAPMMKIERQPRKVDAMKPPKIAVRPDPPQEPIDHRQRVEVAAHRDHRAITVAQYRHQAGLADAYDLLDTVGGQLGLDLFGGAVFLQRKLRVPVEILVPRFPVCAGVGQVGKDRLDRHRAPPGCGMPSAWAYGTGRHGPARLMPA